MTVFDDDDDDCANDETAVVQKIGRLLDEAVAPCKRPRLLTHLSYLDRLQTFSPSTYFAKPIEISPIVCAARGWSNIGTDLLQCSHCNAKLAITFDAKLNPQQCRTVTQKYQEALATKGHVNELCLFYNSKATAADQFSSVLDPDFVQMIMEESSSKSSSLVLERAKKLLLQGRDDLPTVNKTIVDHDDDDALLLEQTVTELRSRCSSEDANRSALALTLLGWSRDDNGNHLSCKLCLSSYKNKNLVTSHKYYCPYLLPSSCRDGKDEEEPCWKQICKRILKEASEEPNNSNIDDEDDPDAAVARIQQLLNQQ